MTVPLVSPNFDGPLVDHSHPILHQLLVELTLKHSLVRRRPYHLQYIVQQAGRRLFDQAHPKDHHYNNNSVRVVSSAQTDFMIVVKLTLPRQELDQINPVDDIESVAQQSNMEANGKMVAPTCHSFLE